MAELVHLRLEHSLTELEEMQRIGLFSSTEIRCIVKKREGMEYKLRRKTKLKDHFLKYIEYEINLLTLVEKRRERLLCDDKKKEIDNSIAKRINRMFKGVITRFPEDETLFLDQIQFCKRMKWYELINALHTRMLQTHSKTPSLWIMAAKWEMEESRSPENARKLLQRGVLINPHSGVLWREYYRMELMYADLIRKRREILEPQNLKSMDTDEDDVVLSGQVANVVYDKAIEEFDDVEYALSFIQICLEFDFGISHIEHILKDVQERFPNMEEVLDALAKKPLLDVEEQIKKGKEVGMRKKTILETINAEISAKYEEAVETIQTEKMWSMYIDFMLCLLNSAKESKKEALQEKVTRLMGRAAEINCLNPSYYIQWIKMLFESGDAEKALSISLVAARKWNNVELWLQCLTDHIDCMQSHELVYNHLKEATSSVKEKESTDIWKWGVNWLSLCDRNRLIQFYEDGIKKCKQVSAPLKEMYLEATAQENDVECARTLYKRLKKMGPLSPLIIKKMIRIESGQLNPSIDVIRKYFEDGIKEFGSSNVDIWLDYLKVEMDHGDPIMYGTLFWRAKKVLDSDLIRQFEDRVVDLTTGRNLPPDCAIAKEMC